MFNSLFLKPVRSMPAKVTMNVDGLDMDNIPQHVAIIMDGNGRWAKARGKIRTQGHKVGAETLKTLTPWALRRLQRTPFLQKTGNVL